MASRKSQDPDYDVLQYGNGFHGHVAGPFPEDVVGVTGAVRYLAQLGAEWGHLSGTLTRESDIDWRQSEMLPTDHAALEYDAIKRSSFTPTLARLKVRLKKTLYSELSKDCPWEIVSLAFSEAFDDAFRGRARSKRKR